MLGGVSNTFQAHSQALPGCLAESTLPAAKVASHSAEFQLAYLRVTRLVRRAPGPGVGRAESQGKCC